MAKPMFLTKNQRVSKIEILERQPEMLDVVKRHQDVVSVTNLKCGLQATFLGKYKLYFFRENVTGF